jgi:hypothetical protein
MNCTPNFELRTSRKCPVAWSWRSVYISSILFSSRLHGVPLTALCVRWLRYARDVSNSDLQWSHLKERNCWVDTLWLFCLFIDKRLSDSSACRLNSVELCTFTLWKSFSQVKQERTQNIKTYSRRSCKRDPFPDIAYSLSTGIATD